MKRKFPSTKTMQENIGTCCYSVTKSFLTPQPHGLQHASLTISWSLPKFVSIALVMPSNHLILCDPLLLPSIFPSIRVFPNESAVHIRWPKYRSFSICPSNEYSGLISCKIDCLTSSLSKGLSRALSSTTVQNISSLVLSLLYGPALIGISGCYSICSQCVALYNC